MTAKLVWLFGLATACGGTITAGDAGSTDAGDASAASDVSSGCVAYTQDAGAAPCTAACPEKLEVSAPSLSSFDVCTHACADSSVCGANQTCAVIEPTVGPQTFCTPSCSSTQACPTHMFCDPEAGVCEIE